MGIHRIVAAFALSAPLAGCYGVTTPKPLPEWAMYHAPPAVERVVVRRPTTPQTVYVPQGAPTQTVSVAARPRDAAAPPPAPLAAMTPFTPEWQAHEDALEERLRRRMQICRGC